MLEIALSVIQNQSDKDKLSGLYEQYKRFIKYLALSIYDNDEFAEDVLQDTIIALIKLIDNIDDIYSKKTKALIITISKRIAINKFKRENKTVHIDSEQLNAIEDSTDVYSSVYQNDLLNVIDKMQDTYREVLMLKVLYGASVRQIAKVLDISEATVRKRFERARKLLKDLL